MAFSGTGMGFAGTKTGFVATGIGAVARTCTSRSAGMYTFRVCKLLIISITTKRGNARRVSPLFSTQKIIHFSPFSKSPLTFVVFSRKAKFPLFDLKPKTKSPVSRERPAQEIRSKAAPPNSCRTSRQSRPEGSPRSTISWLTDLTPPLPSSTAPSLPSSPHDTSPAAENRDTKSASTTPNVFLIAKAFIR